MSKTIEQQIGEALCDPWLLPMFDADVDSKEKKTALKTLLTKELLERDRIAREEERERITKFAVYNTYKGETYLEIKRDWIFAPLPDNK